MDVAATAVEAANLWIAAGGLASGLAVGIVGTMVAARARREPRRQLTYGAEVTPLLSHSVKDLQIVHGGVEVKNPYVVDLSISIRGNVDVLAADYDSGDPITVEMGTSVIDILKQGTYPQGMRQPKIVVHGDKLEIGPSLIGRKSDLTISVVTAGEPDVALHSSLSGTKVQRIEEVERRYDKVIEFASLVGRTPILGLAFHLGERAGRAFRRGPR